MNNHHVDLDRSGTDRVSASTAELVKAAAEQISQLVRQEFRLATVEMTEKGKRAGIGAGFFGAAGAMAFYGGAALVVMVGFLFAYVMPAWLAALVTAALLFAAAGVAALAGRGQVKRAGKLMPEQAVASASADVQTVVHAARGGEH